MNKLFACLGLAAVAAAASSWAADPATEGLGQPTLRPSLSSRQQPGRDGVKLGRGDVDPVPFCDSETVIVPTGPVAPCGRTSEETIAGI